MSLPPVLSSITRFIRAWTAREQKLEAARRASHAAALTSDPQTRAALLRLADNYLADLPSEVGQ